MSLPIPYHLRGIAEEIRCTADTLTLQLRCGCGCERFCIYQNAPTPAEKAALQEYNAALSEIYSGGGSHFTTQDADGSLHYFKKRLMQPAEEYTLPERPEFAGLDRIEAACAECGAETVLFDNRFHGYDGAVCGTDIPFEYEPQMKQKFARSFPQRRIRIELECTVSPAEFAEITDGAAGTEALFSECFTDINILAEDKNGKYRTFYSSETA